MTVKELIDELQKMPQDIQVADINGNFIRIQCKTSTWATDTAVPETAFHISTSCQTTNTKKTTSTILIGTPLFGMDRNLRKSSISRLRRLVQDVPRLMLPKNS